MILGRVIGELWATRKSTLFEGYKVMLVAVLGSDDSTANEPSGEVIAALDTLGARPGHTVTVSWGSGARATIAPPDNRHLLVDAAISRIVDATSSAADGTEQQTRKE